MAPLACSACGFSNRADARFCGGCGAALGRSCASCGAVVEAGLSFCTACGAPQAVEEPVVAPSAEERKVVSVLFVDLVGFTGRAETLDPEDLRRLHSPYYARVREEIGRFDGTVEKIIGDAVVGFFGAPLAHEDDPERAVRAALAIREAIAELNRADPSLDLQVRAGIATGEAVIALEARVDQGDQFGAGDVLVTASRLQANAPVDGVLVDEATYRSTEHAVQYGDERTVEAKGKIEPVRAWEALAPRARLGIDIAFRGRAPLIGRRDELDVLTRALARVERERSSQLVTVVGEAGMGKSRLVYELFSWIEGEPGLFVTWRQGRSLPYGEGVSFWAFGEMVKAQAGILESDAAEAAEAKLARAVDDLLEGSDAEWVRAHLRPLVGLAPPYEPRAEGQAEAFAAWRRFVEALAERRPLVLVFEDLHWADEGLLDFVDHLVGWAAGVPLLVLCTARPELVERAPAWGGGKLNAVTIALPPLAPAQSEELLTALLGEAPEAELVARAGGNPLYAEEYARMRDQRDGGDVPLPDSVQGIIAARLDRLPPAEKAIVQGAAVVGKVFWGGALASMEGADVRVLDEPLHSLERKEFVRRERRSSVEGETAYVFRHVLVRDVAYAQIPRATRAEKHLLTAEWIESLAGDRTEDVAEMLAHHYLQALDYSRSSGGDAGALEERARPVFREAGDRAAALNAFVAAARYYRAALELTPEDDAERPQLLFRYGRARFFSEDEGREELGAAAEELLDAGDRESSAEAQAMMGELRWIEGERDAAFAHFEGAVALLADERPSRSKAYALGTLARFLMVADEAERAIAIGFEAFTMAEELELDDIRANVLASLGVARMTIGDLGGRVDLERAIQIADGINSPEVIRAYNNLASSFAALGDLEPAFELYRLGTRAAKRFGRVQALRWFEAEQMLELYWRGRWDEAARLADEFIAQAEAGLHHHREVDARLVRARIALARGEADRAVDDSAHALEFAERVRDPQSLFPALAFHARALAASGRDEDASTVASTLIDAWSMAGVTFAAYWLADLAAALVDLGRSSDLEDAAPNVRLPTRWLDAALAVARGDELAAAGVYAEIGTHADEADARLRAAGRLAEAGRTGEAEQEAQAALDFYRSVRADRYVAQAEEVLAAVR